MPPKFPGMDPFIEGQKWPDFHTRTITTIGEFLTPVVRPRYEVEIERRVYVETLFEDDRAVRPDLTVSETRIGPETDSVSSPDEQVAPVLCALPRVEEKRESLLVIKDLETRHVVTVVELLSPGNKRAGSEGRSKYLEKRAAILDSPTHLVEIDLLRSGERLQMGETLPPGDYFVIVSRGREQNAEVYAWQLPQTIPTVGIPLASGDADVRLPLSSVFTTVYDRAGYDYSLRYDQPVVPAPSPETLAWIGRVANAS